MDYFTIYSFNDKDLLQLQWTSDILLLLPGAGGHGLWLLRESGKQRENYLPSESMPFSLAALSSPERRVNSI